MFGFLSNIFSGVKSQDYTEQNIQDLNPKFKDFESLSPDEQEAYRNSIFDKWTKEQGPNGGQAQSLGLGWDQTSSYNSYVYGGIQTAKPARLQGYRRMSQFPEVSDAVDEICDSSLNYDEKDNLVELVFNEDKLKEAKASEVKEKYDEYMSLFKLETNYYDFMRLLMVEGELVWENIIDTNNKEAGIIGVNYIPTESYEFLINDKGEKQGISVYLEEKKDEANNNTSNYTTGGVNVQDAAQYQKNREQNQQQSSTKEHIAGQETIELSQKKGVPMKWDQITYVDSGIYNPNRLIVYPILERSRKAYRQLSLIEDAILINRLVRAPLRLVFNVDTGKMPYNKAMQEVQKLMKRYQTKKFYNPMTGSVSNDYDPTMMMENFWMPKAEGSTGTTVEKLDQGVNWTVLPDLEYFQRKLYNSLKIPFENRMAAKTQVKIEKGENITAEEYRFAKFIMKLQDRFSIGFTKGFITHLKLTGVWDRYELTETDVKIKFVPPMTYLLYQQSLALKTKVENYNIITKDHPEISQELAMKQFLSYTEEMIKENNERVEREALFKASLQYKIEKTKATGNPYSTTKP